jgi:two-component system phosphate regulon sensor histidine kinase PhoR
VRRELRLAARKQDFVAAVTHELRTPLAGIRMYAEMLGEGWVPEGASAREYAGRIVGESQRLSALVDQVLDLAAHDRGTARAKVAPGDLAAAVRGAVALAEGSAREAQVPLSFEVEPSLPHARFDPDLLRPLVLNLVDNAVKYSAKAATKEVRVLVRRGGGGVEVVVADRGPGLPDEVRRHLFEPFTRGGREDTREARGVGLGLALVRRYADAMGARVNLDSEPGRGTTAVVRFRAE